MKRILLLTVIVIMSITGYSQTTQEEYNYATKGLKAQYANGLDMKKGYTIELYYQSEKNSSNWLYSYYLLKKDGETKPVAIVLVSGESLNSAGTMFFCIPSYDASPTLWKLFKESCAPFQQNLSYETAKALSKALTEK